MKQIVEITIISKTEIDTDDYPDGATAQECVDIDMEVDSGGFVASLDIIEYTAKFINKMDKKEN